MKMKFDSYIGDKGFPSNAKPKNCQKKQAYIQFHKLDSSSDQKAKILQNNKQKLP